jgi:predicted metalloprotease with PDZ domain
VGILLRKKGAFLGVKRGRVNPDLPSNCRNQGLPSLPASPPAETPQCVLDEPRRSAYIARMSFERPLLIVTALSFLASASLAGTPGEDVARLGDSSFRVREKASAALKQAATTNHAAVLEACIAGYAATDDVEILSRLDEIMLPVVERKLYNRPKGFLGLRLEASAAVLNGKAVPAIEAAMIVEGQAAEKAGVKMGDLILAMDGKPVTEDGTSPFIAMIQEMEPGTTVRLDILRGENRVTLPVVLSERPPDTFFVVPEREPIEEFYDNWKNKAVETLKAARPPAPAP